MILNTMNYKEIITDNSDWIKEIGLHYCIECCFSIRYRDPSRNKFPMGCTQIRKIVLNADVVESCRIKLMTNSLHYELQRNNN